MKPIDFFGWNVTSKAESVATNQRNLFWVYLGALAVAMLVGHLVGALAGEA